MKNLPSRLLPFLMARYLSDPFGEALCRASTTVFLALCLQLVLVHLEVVLLLLLARRRPSRLLSVDERLGRRVLLGTNALLAAFFSVALCLPFRPRLFFHDYCLGVYSGQFPEHFIQTRTYFFLSFSIFHRNIFFKISGPCLLCRTHPSDNMN